MSEITPAEWTAILLSLRVAIIATLVATPFGIALAWLLARTNFWGKSVLDALVHLPLVLPPVVTGYLLLLTFGRRGPVGAWLADNLGIVFAFQLVSSSFFEPPASFPEVLRAPAFMVHVASALLGYSGLAVSAVYGLLYLMLFYDIKKHRFGLIYKQLPSLEVMASFTYRSATLGLLFLTVAMVGGFILLMKVYGTYWSWDPKLLTTLIAWLIYSLGLGASRIWGWSAKRMAVTSIAGFTVILFSLVIVNLVLTRFHVFV